MQSLGRTIKLPPTVIRRLMVCEDAQAQAEDYLKRYMATARRYEEASVSDEFDAIKNSAIYNRRVAYAMKLLALWLDERDTKTALERLQSTTWRAMYQELGIQPDAPVLERICIDTPDFMYEYAYDPAALEPGLVPDWAVALIAELIRLKWDGELAEVLLKLHQQCMKIEYGIEKEVTPENHATKEEN